MLKFLPLTSSSINSNKHNPSSLSPRVESKLIYPRVTEGYHILSPRYPGIKGISRKIPFSLSAIKNPIVNIFPFVSNTNCYNTLTPKLCMLYNHLPGFYTEFPGISGARRIDLCIQDAYVYKYGRFSLDSHRFN